MNWIRKLLGVSHESAKPKSITKEEFSSLWLESGAHAAINEVMSGRNVPIEEHFTTRVDYIVSKCTAKWGISKRDCIGYLKQYEGITDNEFAELYKGRI